MRWPPLPIASAIERMVRGATNGMSPSAISQPRARGNSLCSAAMPTAIDAPMPSFARGLRIRRTGRSDSAASTSVLRAGTTTATWSRTLQSARADAATIVCPSGSRARSLLRRPAASKRLPYPEASSKPATAPLEIAPDSAVAGVMRPSSADGFVVSPVRTTRASDHVASAANDASSSLARAAVSRHSKRSTAARLPAGVTISR